MPEAGIKINGKHYATPSSFRLGETRTIKRITGLNPPEFLQALPVLDKTQDPDVLAAMVWWIMHREDPSITIEAIEELDYEAIAGEGGGEPVDPKAGGATSASSPSSADASSVSPVALGETILANGGGPGLVPSGLLT